MPNCSILFLVFLFGFDKRELERKKNARSDSMRIGEVRGIVL